VLDADIRGFFDVLDHEWMVKFIEHRIADPRVIRHIKKWLNAGVLEQGKLMEQEEGVPQGGSVSPCWPTSTCIMCWTCGPNSGDDGRRGVT
jgi:retron-type reverse transcriptase